MNEVNEAEIISNTYNERLKDVKDLSTLFELWFEYQKKILQCVGKGNGELNKLRKHMERRRISVESFCKDGKIGENDNSVKALYILREENRREELEKADESARVVLKDFKAHSFWVQEQVRKVDTFEELPPFIKKLLKVQYRIENQDKENHKKEPIEEIKPIELGKNMAFMNLNKLGGAASVHWPTFNAYLSVFKKFIIKEIELINPEVIVCCGTYGSLICDVYDKELEVGHLLNNGHIFTLPHPSASGISINNYGEKQIKRCNEADKEKQSEIDVAIEEGLDKIRSNYNDFSEDMKIDLISVLDNYI